MLAAFLRTPHTATEEETIVEIAQAPRIEELPPDAEEPILAVAARFGIGDQLADAGAAGAVTGDAIGMSEESFPHPYATAQPVMEDLMVDPGMEPLLETTDMPDVISPPEEAMNRVTEFVLESEPPRRVQAASQDTPSDVAMAVPDHMRSVGDTVSGAPSRLHEELAPSASPSTAPPPRFLHSLMADGALATAGSSGNEGERESDGNDEDDQAEEEEPALARRTIRLHVLLNTGLETHFVNVRAHLKRARRALVDYAWEVHDREAAAATTVVATPLNPGSPLPANTDGMPDDADNSRAEAMDVDVNVSVVAAQQAAVDDEVLHDLLNVHVDAVDTSKYDVPYIQELREHAKLAKKMGGTASKSKAKPKRKRPAGGDDYNYDDDFIDDTEDKANETLYMPLIPGYFIYRNKVATIEVDDRAFAESLYHANADEYSSGSDEDDDDDEEESEEESGAEADSEAHLDRGFISSRDEMQRYARLPGGAFDMSVLTPAHSGPSRPFSGAEDANSGQPRILPSNLIKRKRDAALFTDVEGSSSKKPKKTGVAGDVSGGEADTSKKKLKDSMEDFKIPTVPLSKVSGLESDAAIDLQTPKKGKQQQDEAV